MLDNEMKENIDLKIKRYENKSLKGLSRIRRNCKIESDITILEQKYKPSETLEYLINQMKKLRVEKPL